MKISTTVIDNIRSDDFEKLRFPQTTKNMDKNDEFIEKIRNNKKVSKHGNRSYK